MTVVAQEKHERLMKACLNNAAEWLTVHIDPCLASGIVVTKLCGGRPTKGVTEYSHSRQVEPSRELTGQLGAVQPLQPIKYERDVGNPRGQHSVHTAGLPVWLLAPTELRVILRRPPHHSAVRENDHTRAIGRIEAHYDVTVTGQIL